MEADEREIISLATYHWQSSKTGQQKIPVKTRTAGCTSWTNNSGGYTVKTKQRTQMKCKKNKNELTRRQNGIIGLLDGREKYAYSNLSIWEN